MAATRRTRLAACARRVPRLAQYMGEVAEIYHGAWPQLSFTGKLRLRNLYGTNGRREPY